MGSLLDLGRNPDAYFIKLSWITKALCVYYRTFKNVIEKHKEKGNSPIFP